MSHTIIIFRANSLINWSLLANFVFLVIPLTSQNALLHQEELIYSNIRDNLNSLHPYYDQLEPNLLITSEEGNFQLMFEVEMTNLSWTTERHSITASPTPLALLTEYRISRFELDVVHNSSENIKH